MNRPSFLDHDPVAIAFGTSGMRALVSELTDLQVYVSVKGALRYLLATGTCAAGHGVVLGGDLRPSTPRIMRAAAQAIVDSGLGVENAGMMPTPALVLLRHRHARSRRHGHRQPHPVRSQRHQDLEERRRGAQVRRAGHPGRDRRVCAPRSTRQRRATSRFDAHGMLKLPRRAAAARRWPASRCTPLATCDAFAPTALAGLPTSRSIEHSAVGRDLLPRILPRSAPSVVPVGRSDDLRPHRHREHRRRAAGDAGAARRRAPSASGPHRRHRLHRRRLRPPAGRRRLARARSAHRPARPLPARRSARPRRRRDAGADVVAVPVSSQRRHRRCAARERGMALQQDAHRLALGRRRDRRSAATTSRTRVSSAGRRTAASSSAATSTASPRCPTRDALLADPREPVAAHRARIGLPGCGRALPRRFGRSGPPRRRAGRGQPPHRRAARRRPRATSASCSRRGSASARSWRSTAPTVVRLRFANGDVAHLRPSGNAPQLRIYATADSQRRADEIVALALDEHGGILRRLLSPRPVERSEHAPAL